MMLRRKSFLIVAGTALALIVTLYFAGRRIILDSALRVEQESITLDVLRVVDALNTEADRLKSAAGDWATWDDTYAFVADHNPEYVMKNLGPSSLRTLKVNLMVFLDTEGGIVMARAVDLESGADRPDLVRELTAAISRDRGLWTDSRSPSGVLQVAGGNLLVATEPILRSDRGGPRRGTLVFARWFAADDLSRVARIANLEARIYGSVDTGVPLAIRRELQRRDPSAPVVIRPLGFRTVAGYIGLEDLRGKASLVLMVTELRAVYVQGVRSLSYFIGALLLAVVCFGILVTVLLERLVLARLLRLSTRVHQIGGALDFSQRVSVAGADEIAALGGEVNGMLARLERAHGELRSSRDDLEQRVSERTAELEDANEALHSLLDERVRAERALLALKEELEHRNRELLSLDRMKDALIGDVSHELRTPVAKQAMQLELMRGEFERRGLHEDFASILRVMDGALRRQQSVIRNILTLSRLEAGGRGVRLGPVRLDELLLEVVEDYRDTLATCGIAVSLELSPLTLNSDRELLWHVFSNLVSNAVKYRGPLDPRVQVAATGEEGQVRVRVSDNGVGFDPQSRERVFERFYQESAAVEGIGLGLHIVKMILAQLGGEIAIDSPGKNRGTVAEVVLPR